MIRTLTSRSVLVVDSDARSRDGLAILCASAGWSVRTAGCCDEVLTSSAVPAPDYLLVEENPLDATAHFLFRRLRDLNPRLEAVMFSRKPSIQQAVQAIRTGFRDYRCVPIDRACLQDLFTGQFIAAIAPRNDVTPAKLSLEAVQWNHIRSVLTGVGGNVSEAARILGVHRRSLQRKLSRRSAQIGR